MKPWTIDAKDIGKLDDINPSTDIILTGEIIQFIESEREHKYFIVGPKGFGKTLLLLYKRLLYEQKHTFNSNETNREPDLLFIPQRELVDRGTKFLDFSVEKTAYLSESEHWCMIWFFCIVSSVVKRIKAIYDQNHDREKILDLQNNLKRIDSETLEEYNETPQSAPHDFLSYVLKGRLNRVIRILDNNGILQAILKNIQQTIVIFIDNVDQTLQKHLEAAYRDQNGTNNKTKVMSPEIWYAAQVGLIEAIETLSGVSRHLRVFATIRKEAFLKIEDTNELSQQIRSHTLNLEYKKDQLEEIFRKNVNRMRTDNFYMSGLVCPNEKDELKAFLGLSENKITNVGVHEQEENIFNYIYRHTLKRPRDFMSYGELLTGINKIMGSDKPEDYREQQIREAIHEVSISIVKEYLAETGPHINFSQSQFSKLFSLLNSNILTLQEAKNICRSFNGLPECKASCRDCKQAHPMCSLYQIGLIGIIREDQTRHMFIQEFLPPGCSEIHIHKSKALPVSKYYLVHPILNKTIENLQTGSAKNVIYRVNQKIIIGDGYPWDDSMMRAKIVGVHKTEILKTPAAKVMLKDKTWFKSLGRQLAVKFFESKGYKVTEDEILGSLEFDVIAYKLRIQEKLGVAIFIEKLNPTELASAIIRFDNLKSNMKGLNMAVIFAGAKESNIEELFQKIKDEKKSEYEFLIAEV